MTLNRAVVGIKSSILGTRPALCRAIVGDDSGNLCILLPDEQERQLSDMQIRVPVDRQIVGIVSQLDLRSTSSGHSFEAGRNNQGLEPGEQSMSPNDIPRPI
jgi:hypothetical protein